MILLVSANRYCNLHGIQECYNFSLGLDLSSGHHLSSSHPCPNLSLVLPVDLGHFPNIPSTFPLQLAIKSPEHHHFKGYIFFLFLSHLIFLHSLFFLPRVLYMLPCPTEWSSWSKNNHCYFFIIFQHLSWCFICRQAELWAIACV